MADPTIQYNDPAGSVPSTIGPQTVTAWYQKKALVEARRTQVFMQQASVTDMPKNHGQKIERFVYIPLLDDLNVNDQGIDGAGATIANGNLYGSSRDVGTIASKLPLLGEAGGRVNRVGFKRRLIEGSFEKFGYFDEFTQAAMDFDSDAELMMHINREMLNAAHEMTEAALQIDLLGAAGVVKYAGTALADGDVNETSLVEYRDLMNLSLDLDRNRTPKQTTQITGTRLVDTRVIPNARALYCGSELLPTLRAMKDLHGEPAFISVEHYASGGTTLNHEAGSLDAFRVVIVPEMLRWAGKGKTTADASIHTTAGKADIFPMLVIGDQSFTTIGFQTNGKTVKFTIFHKKPGLEVADWHNPYGEIGFMSIKWFYGFMVLRPERIGLIKTAAKI